MAKPNPKARLYNDTALQAGGLMELFSGCDGDAAELDWLAKLPISTKHTVIIANRVT